MADLYAQTSGENPDDKNYFVIKKAKYTDQASIKDKISKSTTVYLGNLSFYTSEEQLWEVFSKCGDVKRIILGLNKRDLTPCGFAFVEFYTAHDVEDAIKYLNGARVDGRPIKVEKDPGFEEGRQYGRGSTGGQVRDEMRTTFDADRGGITQGSTLYGAPGNAGAGPSGYGGGGGRGGYGYRGGPPPPPSAQYDRYGGGSRKHGRDDAPYHDRRVAPRR